jgi:hypothetical protein
MCYLVFVGNEASTQHTQKESYPMSTRTFKSQQVLRTLASLIATVGEGESATSETVPTDTRVTVLQIVDDATIRAKVTDPRFPNLKGRRITAPPSAFAMTSRGRPKGTGKPKAPKAVSAEAQAETPTEAPASSESPSA